MLSRTHLLFGFFILLLSNILFDIEITLILVMIAFFASLLPDIDEKSSKLGRKAKIVSFIFDHRGLLHTVWFAILFSILVYELIGNIEGIMFFTIYSSHLISDGLTKQGIKLFYPLNIRLKGNIKVGGLKEKLFFYLLLIIMVSFIFNNLINKI